MENIAEAKLRSLVRHNFTADTNRCPRCGGPVLRDVRHDYGGKGWCFACGWVYYGNGYKPIISCRDGGREPAYCIEGDCSPQKTAVMADPLLEALAGLLGQCGDCESCRVAKRCRQLWLEAINASAIKPLRAGEFRRLALRFYDLQKSGPKGLIKQQTFARAERQ